MPEYYTANVKTKFKAYINDVEFTEQDEYYAVKRFLEKFCNPIEEIKSENPDFKFDKIPNQLIRHFIYTIFEASGHGDITYYKILDLISIKRKYETKDLTDIYITYMGQKDTYFREMNELFETNGF